MTRFSYWRLGSALLFVGTVSLILVGCSRAVGSVSGKVTFQGKALKGGNVSFQSTDGHANFAAGIKEDGTYEVPNIQAGSYKVSVETASLKPPAGPLGGKGSAVVTKDVTGKVVTNAESKGLPPAGADIPEGYKGSSPATAQAAANLKKYVQIPDKYSDAEKSDITYTFKSGSDTFDIELK